MSLLARFLVGLYLRTFALCLLGAIGLLLVVEFFTRIGDFAAYDSSPALVAAYFALKTPKWLVEVWPAASLLAVLLGVGSLVRTSEIVAMRACGLSLLQVGRPLILTAAALSAFALAFNEVVVPPTASRARSIKDIDIKSLDSRGMLDAKSLWIQVPRGFLNIDWFDATTNRLEGITLHELDERFRLTRLVEIPGARWQDDRWKWSSGTVRSFSNDGDFAYGPLGDEAIDLGGSPAEFRRKAPRSDEFNVQQLTQRIRTLRAKGLDPAAFETDLHFKVALPLSGIITVLIGLPLALRGSPRSGSTQHVGAGMAVCFLYWLLQAVTVSAGHAGALPPVVAAWSANAIFVLVGALLAMRS